MSEPVTTPFTDAGPGMDPAGQASAAATLAALQARVRKLLLAGHWNSVSHLPRLAKQLNIYTHSVERALWMTPTVGSDAPVDARLAERPPTTSMRFQEEGEELIQALDALLTDPDNASLHTALEETMQRIGGAPPRGSGNGSAPKPGPGPDPAGTPTQPPAAIQEPPPAPTNQPTAGAPLVELHRLDTAERHWWEAQHEALRRRTDLALLLAIITIAGLGALLLGGNTPPMPAPRPGPATPAVEAPHPQTRPPDQASNGPLALLSGLSDDDARTLLQLPVRLSELDLEVLRLGARLNALEAHQVAADRARALAPAPSTNPLANAASGAKPTAPPPTPNTQPRTDRPSYGIQLASLKNTDQVQQFIAEHAIDPRQVRVVQTGNRVLLIHGLFTDRGQSGATIPSLPQSLRRQGPIIHTFAPGEPPPPLAGGDQPLTTDQRQ
jgi:hypothetical protein